MEEKIEGIIQYWRIHANPHFYEGIYALDTQELADLLKLVWEQAITNHQFENQ